MLQPLLATLPFYRLTIGGTPHWYVMRSPFFSSQCLDLVQDEAMQRLEAIGSSHFYLERDTQTLFKLVRDKYDARHRFAKWLSRDILDKRLLGGGDAFKEWRSNRILRRAGLQTVECRGLGVAVNILNPLGSLYAMPYLSGIESGEAHFRRLDEPQRLTFIERLCDDVIVLARHGYYHRDLHYGNVMVSQAGEPIWIDTHIRRLPHGEGKRRQRLVDMLSPSKLQGARYRDHAECYLIREFDTQA